MKNLLLLGGLVWLGISLISSSQLGEFNMWLVLFPLVYLGGMVVLFSN